MLETSCSGVGMEFNIDKKEEHIFITKEDEPTINYIQGNNARVEQGKVHKQNGKQHHSYRIGLGQKKYGNGILIDCSFNH